MQAPISQPQSDEAISTKLSEILLSKISPGYRCISNSLILPSKTGSYLVYFARKNDGNRSLVMIAINISAESQQSTPEMFKVKTESMACIDSMVLELSQSPHIIEAFSVLAYDPRQKASKTEKYAFLTNISIDQLKNEQFEHGPYVELWEINKLQKKLGAIKDIKWYPFAVYVLVILTDTKILILDMEQTNYSPIPEINIYDQQVVNASESTGKGQFQKLGFAQNLDKDSRYSSFGKKLSLFLASNSGAVYMVYPFLSNKIILDENEKKQFENIKTPQSNRASERTSKLVDAFSNSDLMQVKESSSKENLFNLQTILPSKQKAEIFKLTSALQSSKSFVHQQNPYHKIQVFQPLTLVNHTIFMLGAKLKTGSVQLKTTIFSTDPYRVILEKQTNSKIDPFKVETLSEVHLNLPTQTDKILYGNTLQLKLPKSFGNNEVYLLHNNTTCYRFSLFKLENFLRKQQNDQSELKLVDVDIVFSSKFKILTMVLNDINIFILKNLNDEYTFESVPLKSLELKEKINKTILETEELFKKLAAKGQKHGRKPEQDPKVNLEEFKQSSLAEVETKIRTFSEDYQKSVEFKFSKIKKLYEHIQSLQDEVKKQEYKKDELIKLVNEAQENEIKIKAIFSNRDKTTTNKTEDSIRRRICGVSKLLEDIKTKLDKEREDMRNFEKDGKKSETIEECLEQADGMLNQLQNLKKQLIERKQKLQEELGKENAY